MRRIDMRTRAWFWWSGVVYALRHPAAARKWRAKNRKYRRTGLWPS